MSRLLPSDPDIEEREEPRVVGLDSDAADELIGALSSTTARRILAELHEEPASPARLANRVDTSLQNVQYHLGNLEEAGLIEVGDTVYSEKGREMNVYAPADRALVVVAGREEETTGLKSALSRLLGGVAVLGLASVVVDRLARRGLQFGLGSSSAGDAGGAGGDAGATATAGDGGAGGAAGTPSPTPTPTEAATPEPTATATESPTTTGDGVGVAEATTTAEPTATATSAPTGTPPGTATPTPMATETPTPTPMATETPTRTPAPDLEATTTVVETTASAADGGFITAVASSPGFLFFLGGTTVLLAGFTVWWLRTR